MVSQVKLANIQRRIDTYPSQIILKIAEEEMLPKLILLLQGQHHPDTKTRQR